MGLFYGLTFLVTSSVLRNSLGLATHTHRERVSNIIYGGVGSVPSQLRQSILQRNLGGLCFTMATLIPAYSHHDYKCGAKPIIYMQQCFITHLIYMKKGMMSKRVLQHPVVTHFSSKEPLFMFLPATSEKTERSRKQ